MELVFYLFTKMQKIILMPYPQNTVVANFIILRKGFPMTRFREICICSAAQGAKSSAAVRWEAYQHYLGVGVDVEERTEYI